MSEQSAGIVESMIRSHCKILHLPTIGSQFARLAAEAVKAKQSHAPSGASVRWMRDLLRTSNGEESRWRRYNTHS